MIRFKDFAPQITKQGFFKKEFQSFDEAVSAVNDWVSRHQVDVINIETVVLPEMWSEEGTTDTNLTTSGDMMNSWYQFIRLWYKYD